MKGVVLFTVVAFVAAVAFGSIVMAKEKSNSSMQGSKLEMVGPERDVLAMGSLLSAGYVVVNSYETCSAGKNGFITFDMFGVPIESPDGELLGSVRNLLLNERNYDDAFAVINIGGSRGRLIPIPVTALEISETQSGKFDIVLNSTKAELEAAPLFSATKIDNPQYDTHIYIYFGVQPYWAEECPVRGM
jgi:hypothetical protein